VGDELVDDGVPLGGVTSTSEDVMDEGGVILQVKKKGKKKQTLPHTLCIRYRLRYTHTPPLTVPQTLRKHAAQGLSAYDAPQSELKHVAALTKPLMN
jgi:hypothetical protein